MSALTKVFILLHVVMSMLLAAGLVVFVNRLEVFNKAYVEATDAAAAANARASTAENARSTDKSAAEARVNAAIADAQAARGELERVVSAGAEKDKQIAEATVRAAAAEASQKSQTEAVKLDQSTIAMLENQIKDLRERGDKLQETNTQQSLAVADLTNKWTVTRKQLQLAQEQIEDLQGRTADRGGAGGKGGNGDVNGGPAAAVTAPPINGVIRAKKNIGGIDYATISVGSSDSVSKGMKFSVVDRKSGDFLGNITIISVEPNEATGRLDGPRKNDINPGSEVRTSLQ